MFGRRRTEAEIRRQVLLENLITRLDRLAQFAELFLAARLQPGKASNNTLTDLIQAFTPQQQQQPAQQHSEYDHER